MTTAWKGLRVSFVIRISSFVLLIRCLRDAAVGHAALERHGFDGHSRLGGERAAIDVAARSRGNRAVERVTVANAARCRLQIDRRRSGYWSGGGRKLWHAGGI